MEDNKYGYNPFNTSQPKNNDDKLLEKFYLIINKAKELKAEGNQFYVKEKYVEASLRYEGALEAITHNMLSDLYALDPKGSFQSLMNLKKECKLNLALMFLKLKKYHEAIQECNDVFFFLFIGHHTN